MGEIKRQRDEETKRQSLPQPLPKGKGFVAALMHHHGLKETKSQRDEETKSGGDKGSKRLRVKGTKRQRVGEGKAKKNLRKAKKN